MHHPTVLCSLLSANATNALTLGQTLRRAHLDLKAHHWDNSTATLSGVLAALSAPDCIMWCIAGEKAAFADASTRRALSLTALGVQAMRGRDFPLMLLCHGGKLGQLPTPLADVAIVENNASGSILARLRNAHPVYPLPWRLAVHCQQMGIWLETGPATGTWQGALCGTSGYDVYGAAVRPLAHAVGLAGLLPSSSVLECPLQNLTLPSAEGSFIAWGAGNTLTPTFSYYIQLSALPEAILLGPFPRSGQTDLTVVHLEQGGAPLRGEAPAQPGTIYLKQHVTYKHAKRGAPTSGSQRS